MSMPSDKSPIYNMHIEVLLEQVRLVAFFALGKVTALSYLPFLQHFQPHILRVCLFYTAKFPAYSSWLYDPLNEDIFLSPGFCVVPDMMNILSTLVRALASKWIF